MPAQPRLVVTRTDLARATREARPGLAPLPELVLQEPTAGDVDAVTRWCQDPDVQAWTTIPVPYSRSDAVRFLDDVGPQWAAGSAYTWGIREGGELVGMIGLDLQAAGSAEVGYWLAPPARGRGVVRAALTAVAEHAFDPDGVGLDRLHWQAFVGNWPSRRAAEAVGFRIEGTVRGGGVQRGARRDNWVGTLLRSDPRATPATLGEAAELTVAWRGSEGTAEAARVRVDGDRLAATGTQLGTEPVPYRVDYTLTTGPAFVTTAFDATATGDGWGRRIALRRDPDGRWRCEADGYGAVDLPDPGVEPDAVAGALDVDLGRSPLTNAMPVLRARLHREPGAADLLMALVSVPDLQVAASPQRYEHLARTPDGGGLVRFTANDGAFTADLVIGADGQVEEYPGLARRAR